MICPKCKAEYKRGINLCADCNVALVESLPENKMVGNRRNTEGQDSTFLDIFITGNAGEIAMIKSLLDHAGIDYYFQGERFARVHSGAYPTRLFVRSDQYEEALEILEDLDFGTFGNTDEASE